MKKLVVLLLAFAVAGAAFAQTPALTANSTLSWGVDFDTGYTGFSNASTLTFKVPFAFTGATSKKGDKGWWGDISVKNLYFVLSDKQLTQNDALTFTDWNDADGDGVVDSGEKGGVTAFITNGTWKVSVSNKEGFDYANAASIYDGDVSAALHADNGGTTVSYTAGALSVGATVASKADWTANTKNEYAFGTNASYKVSDALTVSGAVAFDLLDASKDFGATAKVAYSAAPLTVSVASDMYNNATTSIFDLDVLGTVGYNIMKGLDVTVKGFYSTGDDDLEAKATLAYVVDPIDAAVIFGIEDPLTGSKFHFEAYAGYTYAIDAATSLWVYADFTSDFAGANTLTPEVTLTNTSIANTTLTLKYNSGELDVLSGKYGTLIAAAKVTL